MIPLAQEEYVYAFIDERGMRNNRLYDTYRSYKEWYFDAVGREPLLVSFSVFKEIYTSPRCIFRCRDNIFCNNGDKRLIVSIDNDRMRRIKREFRTLMILLVTKEDVMSASIVSGSSYDDPQSLVYTPINIEDIPQNILDAFHRLSNSIDPDERRSILSTL